MSVQVQTKAVVSVAEMARMCSLSRARFYQLVNEGVFPPPLYRIETRRPFFNQDMQEVCLEVRRKNCGINGKPVLFYARRFTPSTIAKAKRTPAPKTNKHADLIDGLRALGLTTVTASQVEWAFQQSFPHGKVGIDDETVLRAVFLHLKRQDSGENVGRNV
jgi:hypothetical protein